ncbi:MAG: hypothetical protein ACRD1T_12195 [Acidimicrobiia bacterium]
MLEALLAATATSGLIVLARGQRLAGVVGQVDIARKDGDEDLPCPWCYSPTASSDERCPSCGRKFG